MRRQAASPSRVVSACVHCGKVATKEALFNGDGATIIERYCDARMEPKEFRRIQTIYSRLSTS